MEPAGFFFHWHDGAFEDVGPLVITRYWPE
jgi:hypothetical protein